MFLSSSSSHLLVYALPPLLLYLLISRSLSLSISSFFAAPSLSTPLLLALNFSTSVSITIDLALCHSLSLVTFDILHLNQFLAIPTHLFKFLSKYLFPLSLFLALSRSSPPSHFLLLTFSNVSSLLIILPLLHHNVSFTHFYSLFGFL